MKVFIYPENECRRIASGISGLRFPPGSYEPVSDPEAADAILCPVPLTAMPEAKDLHRLRWYSGELRQRHVFLDVSDCPDATEREAGRFVYEGEPATFLRCNVRTWMREAASNTVCLGWPVGKADLDAIAEGPFDPTHDVGFHGWNTSSQARIDSVAAIVFGDRAGIFRADVVARDEFYGYVHRDRPSEAALMRANFLRSMARCRIQLCPQSIHGVLPYRFLETLCAARVPLLFWSDGVFPLDGLDLPGGPIPWSDIAFVRPAEEASRATDIVHEILYGFPDWKLGRMGENGRKWFMRWLDDRHWPKIHREIVEIALRGRGVLKP